jgi:hypothetical protein
MPPRAESAAQCALRKQREQRAQDESFADFLASRNQEVPRGLKRSNPDANVEQQRVRPRQNQLTVQGGLSVSYYHSASDPMLCKT